MNAAKLERSLRLQRVLKLLRTGKEYSTLEIINKAGVCAVNSCIDELRENGMEIVCTRTGRTWKYRLERT